MSGKREAAKKEVFSRKNVSTTTKPGRGNGLAGVAIKPNYVSGIGQACVLVCALPQFASLATITHLGTHTEKCRAGSVKLAEDFLPTALSDYF